MPRSTTRATGSRADGMSCVPALAGDSSVPIWPLLLVGSLLLVSWGAARGQGPGLEASPRARNGRSRRPRRQRARSAHPARPIPARCGPRRSSGSRSMNPRRNRRDNADRISRCQFGCRAGLRGASSADEQPACLRHRAILPRRSRCPRFFRIGFAGSTSTKRPRWLFRRQLTPNQVRNSRQPRPRPSYSKLREHLESGRRGPREALAAPVSRSFGQGLERAWLGDEGRDRGDRATS